MDLNTLPFLLCTGFSNALFMPRLQRNFTLASHVCPSVNPHVTIREAQRIFTKSDIGEFDEILSACSNWG